MIKYEDLYCKIYLDTDYTNLGIMELLKKLTSGFLHRRTIYTNWGEFDVIINKDYDRMKCSSTEDGFIYYPYYLEVEAKNSVAQADYILCIKELLDNLRSVGCKAVISCDFEDELAT